MNAIFDFIRQILAIPFSFILGLLYDLTSNYVLAIILLTILVKCCFLPSTVKQQKNLVSTKVYNEKIKLIKTKYSDNPEKQEEKIKKLKEQEPDKKGNTGCLSTIIQFVVMIGLFGVIYTPLSSVLNVSNTAITEMKAVMAEAIEETDESDNMIEIALMKETENHKEELLASNILTEEKINEIITFKEKYNFLGIDLSANPQLASFDKLWLIPLLVFLTGTMLPLQAFIKRKKENPGGPKFPAIEAIPFLSPMMMFLFAFMFSAGVGLYWAITNVLSFAETVVLNIIYNPNKMEISIEDIEDVTKEMPSPIQEIAE